MRLHRIKLRGATGVLSTQDKGSGLSVTRDKEYGKAAQRGRSEFTSSCPKCSVTVFVRFIAGVIALLVLYAGTEPEGCSPIRSNLLDEVCIWFV